MTTARARIQINLDYSRGERSPLLFGHFLEHFHRQIYGGVYDPGSPLADERGFRTDVIEALRRIRPPVIRWPGGCFVSAYHWQDGVGPQRQPAWDKAWRVCEPNSFGTDEFVVFCRAVGAEPYICANAGTGTPEEMSNWVEYCNLATEGRWAALRIANGHPAPHRVPFWSIGNENWGNWEIGAKEADEWRRYATEAAKMMKRVDPHIQLAVAGMGNLDWDVPVLRAAQRYLDFISIHEYGTGYGLEALSQPEPDYATVVAGGLKPRRRIEQAEHVLGALGLLGTIRIAFDEWNPRGWFHPSFQQPDPNLAERDRNDDNATYTMADAISQACFLNACLRHCQTVGMANFSPVVNTRGAIFTHPAGIVLRSTYHVFDLYVNHTFAEVLNPFYKAPLFTAEVDGEMVLMPHVDTCTTFDRSRRRVAVAVTNLHPDAEITCTIQLPGVALCSEGIVRTVNGGSTDAYNDVARPDAIRITEQILPVGEDSCKVQLAPHSVNVVTLQLG